MSEQWYCEEHGVGTAHYNGYCMNCGKVAYPVAIAIDILNERIAALEKVAGAAVNLNIDKNRADDTTMRLIYALRAAGYLGEDK